MAIGKITSKSLDSNAVTSTNLAPGAVTIADIADGEITAGKLHTTLDLSTKTLTLTQASVTAHQGALSVTQSQISDLSTTNDLTEGSSNLYYTDARVGTYISGDRTYGNITTTGYLRGPSTFTIDPAAHGDDTGTLVIAGNLQVDGTTTTINSTTLTVDDLNITLASGAANNGAANGAGITVDGSNATITYDGTDDEWDFNKGIKAVDYSVGDGTKVIDSGKRGYFVNLQNSSPISFLTGTNGVSGSGAQGINVRHVYAGTSYASSTAGAGDIEAKSNFKMAGNVVIDSSRNITSGNVNVTGSITTTAAAGDHTVFNSTGADADFRVRTGANTHSLYVEGNTGNIGIGTSSPRRQMHIHNSASATVGFQLTNGATGQSNDSQGFQLKVGSDTHAELAQMENSDLRIFTNAQERMRIDSSGNVGIGITNPAQLLHVQAGSTGNGTIRVGGGAGLEISHDNAGVTVQRIDSIYRTTSADANLQLRTGILTFHTGASSTERVRIDAGGTVSIQSLPGTTSSGISGASGGSLDLNGGTAFAGRLLLTGYNDSGSNLIGLNNESSGLVMYDYTDSQYIMKTNNDQKVSFGGGFPNVNGSSNGAYNIIVDDGICIGDGGYTHGYVGTNGTDGDVYIAANAYPANLSSDRSVRIAAGSPGGGGPNEIVRYNHSHGAIRNYNNNTTTNKKWWSTNSGNFGEVEEYDYGNKLYFKKTRAVGGYSQMLLLNRYMPNQYDVSFELVSPLDTVTYRHFGIALNHVGSETTNFDYLVLRQRFGNSASNQVRIDRPAGTVGTTEGSSIPNFHDGTKRKIMIQKRASTFRMQVHELNGSVYTYGTISGISWTNSSGYFGFGIYESTGTNTWAEISNLTITDVIG